MLTQHRNALVIAIGCVIAAVAYGGLAPVFGYHVEWAGVTMLAALGAALGLMFLVLHTGAGE